MLQLRPNCECCDKDLAANSTEAMICSYECTFCRQCVEEVLENVCPNCGGGFTPRPIRPQKAYRDGVSRGFQPESDQRVQTRYTRREIHNFQRAIKAIPPQDR